jgi:pimeloyl-ACP methyl ester carboxylesterase
MPHVDADGARLYYEEAGTGFPVVFVHEFAGDYRSWEPQMRYFSRRYRTVAYNARGYPPSDVPDSADAYSQDIACDDIAAVMRGLGIERAHIVGCSMGAFATVHFGMRYREMAESLVVVGCGYGAKKDVRGQFQQEAEAFAARFEEMGMAAVAAEYSAGPTRVQYENKDPRGYAEFQAQFAEHSARGSAMTLANVQARRPSLYDLEEGLRGIETPTLLITGDEDEPCLEANLYMKRAIPTSGLLVLPKTGHAANLEEPEAFNRAVQEFFASVENGRWTPRDPRSMSTSILSTDES